MFTLFKYLDTAIKHATSQGLPGMDPVAAKLTAQFSAAKMLELVMNEIQPARDYFSSLAREHANAGPLDSGAQVKWQCSCRGCELHRVFTTVFN